MQSLRQSHFSLFSNRLPDQASPTESQIQHHDAIDSHYSLFSNHLPWSPLLQAATEEPIQATSPFAPAEEPAQETPPPTSTEETEFTAQVSDRVFQTMREIQETFCSFNNQIPPEYQIDEKEMEVILTHFFHAVLSSELNQNSFFFDKKRMSTKHSAVYFIGNHDFPCLFIKPNIKNTENGKIIKKEVISFGGQKMIKTAGFLIVFSHDFSNSVVSYRYASFSNSFEYGKNQSLKKHYEIDCKRNGFFPISFCDGSNKIRHMFLMPYLGETIDKKWDTLTLEEKKFCIDSIIDDATRKEINDIKIGNTLIHFFDQGSYPKVSLIDGKDQKVVFTFTPYAPYEKNREGRFSACNPAKPLQRINETISDYESRLRKYRYLKSPAPEAEIIKARIFSLAIMFWQLININRADISAVGKIFAYNSPKHSPQIMSDRRKKWCLQNAKTTESPLTDIVLKAYEGSLTVDELKAAVTAQLQIDGK